MVMQFGYISMFAAAFPIGASLSLLFIYIEGYSDILKVQRLARKTIPRKVHQIGAWHRCMMFFAYTSVITNLILFTVSSDQLIAIIPSFYNPSWGQDRNIKDSRPLDVQSMVIWFGLEHFLILIVAVLTFFIPMEPEWVKVYKKRRERKSIIN